MVINKATNRLFHSKGFALYTKLLVKIRFGKALRAHATERFPAGSCVFNKYARFSFIIHPFLVSVPNIPLHDKQDRPHDSNGHITRKFFHF